MRLIRSIHNLSPEHRGSVATIGNFDGVHLGHQCILEQVIDEARRRRMLATVMLFEPQPQEYFAPEQAPARLASLRDKLIALRRYGVDQVLCARFDRAFRSLTAQAFVQDLLVEGLDARYLVVGDDFHFGCGRDGDFAYLQKAGRRFGFEVTDTPTCQVDGERVSSTRVRAALENQDLNLAARLLGRPYAISGRVRYGDQLGRTLGVPTVNLALKRLVAPLQGVYAVRLYGAGLNGQMGAASVGTRPTVDGVENRLEVHILDFQGDLYGKHLTVAFEHFLRGEEKFADLDELKTAMRGDIEQTRALFNQDDGL